MMKILLILETSFLKLNIEFDLINDVMKIDIDERERWRHSLVLACMMDISPSSQPRASIWTEMGLLSKLWENCW